MCWGCAECGGMCPPPTPMAAVGPQGVRLRSLPRRGHITTFRLSISRADAPALLVASASCASPPPNPARVRGGRPPWLDNRLKGSPLWHHKCHIGIPLWHHGRQNADSAKMGAFRGLSLQSAGSLIGPQYSRPAWTRQGALNALTAKGGPSPTPRYTPLQPRQFVFLWLPPSPGMCVSASGSQGGTSRVVAQAVGRHVLAGTKRLERR